MCGIAGGVFQNSLRAREVTEEMVNTLVHRGPDGRGLWENRSGVCLAHRRLAIIDLFTGTQPMTSPDNRHTIVFNGEIYNYLELRRELESYGFAFVTQSDTEVLLHAYAQWHVRALDRLRGMFAFAIWDAHLETLFLARDRLGKKPLVYFWNGEIFAFASEVKALQNSGLCDGMLNREAIDLFFALGYIPAPHSVFRNTFKLPPGHYLTFRSCKITLTRYWTPEASEQVAPLEENERALKVRELLRESVRLRLRSDVPIGLFLSGGVDSSAVASEVVEQGYSPLALSVCFDDDKTDLPYAQCIARHLHLQHEVIRVKGDLLKDWEKILWHFDEPFADTSCIPSFFIARAARDYCKVVLNGDGGDEVFGGYRHYENIRWKQAAKRLAVLFSLKDGDWRNATLVYLQSKALYRRHFRELLIGQRQDKDSFALFVARDAYLAMPACDPLHRALWVDRHLQLPNCFLYKTDIALSAFGVEGRSPLLDHELVEWAQRLPARDLVRGTEKKWLFRQSLRDRLPPEILSRPKWGFGSPIKMWLRGPLKDLVFEVLPTPLLESHRAATTPKDEPGTRRRVTIVLR